MPDDGPLPIFTLPLFPLHSVLFPHLPLQLHIFEERYKAMINQCIERHAPFGVVLIREGSEVGTPAVPFDVGCVARILSVERLQDGCMNLLAATERRFRLLEYMEGDLPYLVGRVVELEEQTDESEDMTAQGTRLRDLFIRYLSLLAERIDEALPEIELPDDVAILSFCVASVAMLPPVEKQQLLEMTDTRARVEAELTWLSEQVEALRQVRSETQEAGPKVLVARPLDLTSDNWQSYLRGTRN